MFRCNVWLISAAVGIGRATAVLFAKQGCARIVIADLNKEALESTKTQILTDHEQKPEILAVPTGKSFAML